MKLHLTLGLLVLLGLASATQNPIFLNETYTSGTIKVNTQSDLFYIHFESRSVPEIDPLVIWLNGGPGCSSLLGLFTENGPLFIDENINLQSNQYSWNSRANMIFVDQPVGTGFAQASEDQLVHNEEEVASDFYTFLVGFLELHPQYKGRRLYITGESYAGHYIPAIAEGIIQRANPDLNLIGLAIGNGWVDPQVQNPSDGLYAYQNNLISALTYYLYVKPLYAICASLSPLPISNLFCGLAQQAIVGYGETPKFNLYDIRIPCVGPLCYDLSRVDKFLAREDVKIALGVPNRNWQECSTEVHAGLAKDHDENISDKVAFALANNVKVLVYSGVEDFVCNYVGGAEWTDAMDWPHQAAFQNAKTTPYVVDGEVVGDSKTVENLTFLTVLGAGHMVPMDQPVAALAMINEFIEF